VGGFSRPTTFLNCLRAVTSPDSLVSKIGDFPATRSLDGKWVFLRKERAALLRIASHPLSALGTWLQLVTRHARRPTTVKQLSCTRRHAVGIIRPTTARYVSVARSRRQQFWRQRVAVARIRSEDGGQFPVRGVCFSAVLPPPEDRIVSSSFAVVSPRTQTLSIAEPAQRRTHAHDRNPPHHAQGCLKDPLSTRAL
jgi:hypothetical protein